VLKQHLNVVSDVFQPGLSTSDSPYHIVGNNPHSSFDMARKGQAHGYDYGLHIIASDVPPPTFGFAPEQPSHYYDHNLYYSITNVLPPTFGLRATSRDREGEEFQ
jgi:hypothetical protein